MTIQTMSATGVNLSYWSNVKVGDTTYFSKSLTDDDKNIVAAAGEKIDGSSSKVPHLAVAIALARQDGNLTGPVTAGFLAEQSNAFSISASTIQRAKAYLLASDVNQQQWPGHEVSYAA